MKANRRKHGHSQQPSDSPAAHSGSPQHARAWSLVNSVGSGTRRGKATPSDAERGKSLLARLTRLPAIVTIMLASCRSPPATVPPTPGGTGLPASAYTGAPVDGYVGHAHPGAPPLPYRVHGPWAPPGLERPWPVEEYLHDGGDSGVPVAVSPDWKVYGLDLEDTVAHYDALDGRTLVEPSNRVHLYAPRFGAVRTITSAVANEQVAQPSGVELPTKLVRYDDAKLATTTLQRQQARGELGTKIASAYSARQGDGAISTALGAGAFQDAFLPFEDLAVIRGGVFDQTEKARLTEGVQAAIVWTRDQAVQVILDRQAAAAMEQDERTEVVYTVDDLRDSPKLRLIKVASTQVVQPGETVDFTIRFDNVGDQPLGNIVLIDNLTTRLEYVPGSAQASVDASFSTEGNVGESHALRWEITSPIDPGEGGIVRFRCRVR